MADLDDFFAKKDKKKPKGKKFTTTEEVAKKLVETGKVATEKPKLREKPTNNPEEEGGENPQVEEEDEWREFEEKGKTDHTGLKIGQMKIDANNDGHSDNDRGTGNDSEENESGEAGSSASGPWKKADDQKETTETSAPVAPTITSLQTSGPTKYKSPHLRNQPAMSVGRSRMKNVAPDIRSEEYFPTLSAKQPTAVESANQWGLRRKRDEGTFEEVRNRGSSKSYSLQDTQSQTAKLSLDNKYEALSQDQS